MQFTLEIQLMSDSTFGRGDGIAGLVDVEIEYDPMSGLPYIGGRRIKGLLVEACADILYASGNLPWLVEAAAQLFGRAGSQAKQEAWLQVGRAELPPSLQAAIRQDIAQGNFRVDDVLRSLTSIRRQTAIDDVTGAPETGSLRSMRVVRRGLIFTSQLTLNLPSKDMESSVLQALLAVCARAAQRGGMGRNRGRGKLQMTVNNAEYMEYQMQQFAGWLGVRS